MVDLSKVMEFLAVKESQARVLLMHHRWNVERVFDALDKGRERLFTESGVPFVKDGETGFHLNQFLIQLEGDRFGFLCTVCFEEVDAKEVTRMDCGHYFCNRC
jgi:ariadne-1